MAARSAVSSRTWVRRVPKRGVYDPRTIHVIADEALLCQVGFIVNGHPAVVPVACARDGDALLLHCSRASRLAKALSAGREICLAITHLDGIVLARSVFHHSMNYRSVVVYGRPITSRPDDGAWSGSRARRSSGRRSNSECRSRKHRPRSEPARRQTSQGIFNEMSGLGYSPFG